MEMAPQLLSRSDVSLKKGFLGFGTKLMYSPTDSPLKGEYYEFKGGIELQLMKVVKGDIAELKEMPDHFLKDNVSTLGNLRLDVVSSDDKKFIAVQLFNYDQYIYNPISDVKVFTDAEAQEIARML